MTSKSVLLLYLTVIFLPLLLVSCGSPSSRLNAESGRKAQFDVIAGKVNRGVSPSQSEFEVLVGLRKDFAGAEEIEATYERALMIRGDLRSLVDLYSGIGNAKLSAPQRANYARALTRLGRFEDALALTSGVDLGSDSEMRTVASLSLFQLDRSKEAKKILDDNWDKILAEKSAVEISVRGLIYFYDGENKKAIETLQKAQEFDPLNLAAANGLSRVYYASGDIEKAKEAESNVRDTFAKLTSAERQKLRFVDVVNRLKAAFEKEKYEDVVQLGREALPMADQQNKKVVYQYIYSALKALGRHDEANRVVTEARSENR
ncbi:MAG: hypothetical protein R2684_11830 [Pyrinomonadaceae bacterium]